MYLGNKKIKELYLGNVKIKEAYLGSILVYRLPVFNGFTFTCNNPINCQFDLWREHGDKVANFTITEIDGNFSNTVVDNNGRTDAYGNSREPAAWPNCLDIYAPYAGTFSVENLNSADYVSGPFAIIDANHEQFARITNILSFDFFLKNSLNISTDIGNSMFSGVTTLPTESKYYHNGENVTTIENLFLCSHITNSLVDIISAIRTACPNLTSVANVFSYNNCLGAPDLDEALELYPEWFKLPAAVDHYILTIISSPESSNNFWVNNGIYVNNTLCNSSVMPSVEYYDDGRTWRLWGSELSLLYAGQQTSHWLSRNRFTFKTASLNTIKWTTPQNASTARTYTYTLDAVYTDDTTSTVKTGSFTEERGQDVVISLT